MNPAHQIEDLQRQLAELQRRLEGFADRPRPDWQSPCGWWLAVLTNSLAYNGTANAEIVIRNSGAWKRSGKSITVVGFWLNSDESPVVAPTLIKAEWYEQGGGVWVPTSIYCKVNNWL